MSRVVIFLVVCLAVVMAVQSGKFVFSNFIGCGAFVSSLLICCAKKMNYLVYFMDNRLLFLLVEQSYR